MYKVILYVRGIEVFIETSTANVNEIWDSSLPVLDIPFISAAAHLPVFFRILFNCVMLHSKIWDKKTEV